MAVISLCKLGVCQDCRASYVSCKWLRFGNGRVFCKSNLIIKSLDVQWL